MKLFILFIVVIHRQGAGFNLERIELWPDGVPWARGSSEEDRPHLIRYAPKIHTSRAAMIVCPGGGYVRRAAHEGDPVARWLASLGINAFVLHYRVSPYRYPVPLADARQAVRLVRDRAEQWGYDRNKIGMLGFSAGGHLAAMTGILDDGKIKNTVDADFPLGEDTHPDLLVLCYPVISMIEDTHIGSRTALAGENASESLLELLSLDRQVGPHTPPVFIWHTSDDQGVPVENSLRLALALKRQSVPFELHIFESGKHGLGLAQEHSQAKAWTKLCERWLNGQGL